MTDKTVYPTITLVIDHIRQRLRENTPYARFGYRGTFPISVPQKDRHGYQKSHRWEFSSGKDAFFVKHRRCQVTAKSVTVVSRISDSKTTLTTRSQGRIGAGMDDSHRDRQLILRVFQSAGDAPSIELLRLIPETIVGILNDPLASTRDKIRATECIMTMQKIQLAAVATASSIKSRRDRKHSEPERRIIDWSSLNDECDTPPRLPRL